MSSLAVYAGPAALERIGREGINARQFRVLVGASGGPKWFVLTGLDRYLFGEFFAGRQSPLYTVGSSIGAWRLACLATRDPVDSITRLARLYSEEKYASGTTVRQTTESMRRMLGRVLGENGAGEIADNRIFRTHIVAARCRGIGSLQSRLAQGLHLGAGAVCNTASPRALAWFFERTLFSNMGAQSPWAGLPALHPAALTENNIMDVMIASGSIPFVLSGVSDIEGAKKGHYWDGGIIDYHFDWRFHTGEELVLYPHYSARFIPGWFDKSLPWRKARGRNLDNVVLVAPGREYVAGLPGGKIPDRKDFYRFDYEERLRIWRQVIDGSEQLADDFRKLVEQGAGLERIQPIASRER